MRTSTILLASILALVGCQKSDGNNGDDDTDAGNGSGSGSGSGTDPGAAFTIQSTDVTIPSGTGNEVTYCYWFHTPNTTPIAVNKWVSDMTSGSHHMIFFAGGAEHADGIDVKNTCGLGTSNGVNQPAWVFASQSPHLEEDLPPDDGTGKPLAQIIQPNTVGAFQMHYLNSTDNPITAHVKLSAYALADGATYTRTDPYITYNSDISIGPGATGVKATATCPTPTGQKFWTMSTHAHKQAVDTQISDSNGMIFESTDWEHPGSKNWNATPFYTVAGKLTWTCTYDNTGDNAGMTVVQGSSAAHDEMCMATGYSFPSTKATVCLASTQLPGGCYCQ